MLHRKPLLNMGLQARIAASTVLSLLVFFTSMGYIGFRSLKASFDVVLEQRRELATTLAVHIDQQVDHMMLQLTEAANGVNWNLTDGDPGAEQAALADLYRFGKNDFNVAVFITDRRGTVLAVEPESLHAEMVGKGLSEYTYIHRALETSQPQISNLITGVTGSVPMVSLVVPLKNKQGRTIGLIGGMFDPAVSTISGLISQISLGQTSYAQLVDGQGTVIASTHPDAVGKPSEHRDLLITLLQRGEVTVAPDVQVTEDEESFSEVIAFAPFPQMGWGITVEQAREETLNPVVQALRQITLIFIVSLALAAVFVRITTGWVIRPVLDLTRASRRIASGDLTTPVTVTARDEVGDLAGDFEAMRRKLAAWGEEMETVVAARTRQLATLYAIDRVTAQTLNLEELVHASLNKVLEELEVEAGGILLLESDGETFRLQAQQGLSGELLENIRQVKLGESKTGPATILKTSRILNLSDAPTGRLASFIRDAGFQTFVSIPLVSAGKPVGLLILSTRETDTFPPAALDFLTSIGLQIGVAVVNAQLYEAEQRQATRLTNILKLSSELITLHEEQAIMDVVVGRTAVLAESPTCTLMLVDIAAQEAVLAAQVGLPEGTPPGLRVPLALPIVRHFETGAPLILPDIDHNMPEIRSVLIRSDIRAFFAYPMFWEAHSLGFITLSSLQPHIPSEEEIAAFQLLAERTAAALENARLYQEMQHRLDELSALFEVSGALRGVETMEEMLSVIMDKTLEVSGTKTGALFLLDESGNNFIVWVARGGMQAMSGASFLRAGSSTARCLEIGQPVQDVKISSVPAPGIAVESPGKMSNIQIPLQVGQLAVGVMHLHFSGPHEFADDEVHLLTAISNMAASAINRAGLFEQLKHRLHELNTLFEMSKAITATLNVESVREFVVSSAMQAVHAEGAFLFLWDEHEKRLILRAAAGFPAEAVLGQKYQPGEGLAGWVFLEGQSANVPNLMIDPRWKRDPATEAALESGQALNALIVLLQVGEKKLGF